MNNEKLLAVLDMSEELKQGNWCCRNTNIKTHESLADLAFRLRDEVGHHIWAGICYVANKMEGRHICKTCNRDVTKTSWNWVEKAEPIHWIIAALIAKDIE